MPKQANQFWKWKNQTATSAELVLYGPISEYSWWGDEVTPKQFAEDLAAIGDVDEIAVRINSGGGDVFAGQAIHTMLKRHKAKVTVYIDGLAASIASIIAMAGDKIVMPRGSMMMIHNPWSSVWGGDAEAFRSAAEVLDKIRDALVEVYEARTGMGQDDIKALMDVETWMTATEAVEKGFADEIEEAVPISASMRGRTAFFNGVGIDFSKFENAPQLPEQKPPQPAQANSTGEGLNRSMTLEELKNKYPDVYQAAVNDGVTQERTRMQALDDIASPGSAEIIKKAKYETGISAAEAAMEIIKAEKARRDAYIKDAQDDADNSGMGEVTPDEPAPKETDDKHVEAAASSLAAAMNRKRGGNR